MNRLIPGRFVAAAAVAVAAFGASPAAYARSDVYLTIGLPGAPVYVEPQPVYVRPQPVYVQPQQVYVRPAPVYAPPVYAPTQVYVRRAAPVYAYSYEEQRAWRRAKWRRHNARHYHHHHQGWEAYQSQSRNWN